MENNWYIKIIKRIYGFQQVDEYRIQEVNRIGNNAFLILLSSIFIELLVASLSMLFIASNLNFVFVTTVLITLCFSIFLTLMVVITYVVRAVFKLHLDEIEVDSNQDYHIKIKKYKSSAIKFSIGMFIMFEILNIVFSLIAGKPVLNQLINPLLIILYIMLSIAMGTSIYIISKHRMNQ